MLRRTMFALTIVSVALWAVECLRVALLPGWSRRAAPRFLLLRAGEVIE